MKKIFNSAFWGALSGIGIGTIVSMIFSILSNTGKFTFSSPEFISKFSNEITASTVSIILFAIIGLISSVSSNIYEIDTCSLPKKIFIHFIIIFITVSAVGYYSMWFKTSSLLSFLITFTIIYLIISSILYFTTKKEIDKINKKFK